MPSDYDEYYIKQHSLDRILFKYLSEDQFSNILTADKKKILTFIRTKLSHAVAMNAQYGEGLKSILTTLLDIKNSSTLDSSLISIEWVELLKNCVKMNANTIKDSLTRHNIHLPSDEEPALKNEYLNFISNATRRLIKTAAKNFGVIPKNEKKRPREEEAAKSTPRQTKSRTVLFAEHPTRVSQRKKPTPTNQQTAALLLTQQPHYPPLKN